MLLIILGSENFMNGLWVEVGGFFFFFFFFGSWFLVLGDCRIKNEEWNWQRGKSGKFPSYHTMLNIE